MDFKLDYTINNNPHDLDDPNEDPCYSVKLTLMLNNFITYTLTIYNPSLIKLEQWKSFTAALKTNISDCMTFGGDHLDIKISTANGKLSFTIDSDRGGDGSTELLNVPNTSAVQTFEKLTDIREQFYEQHKI